MSPFFTANSTLYEWLERLGLYIALIGTLTLSGALQADEDKPDTSPQNDLPKTKLIELSSDSADIDLTLYIPARFGAGKPAVIFLPGVLAEPDQYHSYANALAQEGILVAVHHWYSPFTSDVELARDAKLMAKWLMESLKVDPQRIGIAGHSFGAKDAILAEGLYGGFAAIVAIDPDNSGDLSVVDDYVPKLSPPLLLIGAEIGWQAPGICAPMDANYSRFFEKSMPGTIELTLEGADHVQMLDDPERFGYTICRVGESDSKKAHDLALEATVAFFAQHLLEGPSALQRLPKKFVRVMGIEGPKSPPDFPVTPVQIEGPPLPPIHTDSIGGVSAKAR